MKLFGARVQFPLFEGEGGGAGAGSPGGAAPAGGAPAGGARPAAGSAPASAGGNAGAGGGSPSAFELRDDALVRTPDGRTISFKDYQSELRNTVDGDYRGRYKKAYDALIEEAKRIDAASRGGRQPNAAPPDPLAELDLENQGIVDGRTAAKLVKMLRDTGLTPIANLVQNLQKQVNDLGKQVKGTSSSIGSFNEERSQHEFESTLSKDLSSIEVKGFNGTIDPNNEFVREFARNLYLSYLPDSWKAGEFRKMLGDQISGLVQYIRAADKAYANGASQRLKENFNPARGNGSPQGGRKFKYETPHQIAQRARESGMFGNVNNT